MDMQYLGALLHLALKPLSMWTNKSFGLPTEGQILDLQGIRMERIYLLPAVSEGEVRHPEAQRKGKGSHHYEEIEEILRETDLEIYAVLSSGNCA